MSFYRWKTCVHSTKSKFSAKLSQLYTSAYHGTETKQQTKILIENLKESFNDIINGTEWMDSGKRMNLCAFYLAYIILTSLISLKYSTED